MENNESKDLIASEPSKALELKRELTPKNRVFLQLLSEGVKTLEAYKQAGYKGNDHAAYQLRSDLKEELIKVLEGQGIDRAGLMQSLAELISLPINDVQKSMGVSVKQRLSMLQLLFKMTEATKPTHEDRPKITAFIVNAQPAKVQPSQVIDVTQTE